MRQGTRTIKRINARNYNYVSSQQRLNESVAPYTKQITNSLNVDYVPVYYYSSLHTGLPCSCEQQDSVVNFDDNSDPGEQVRESQTHTSREIVIGREGGSTFGDTDSVEIIDQDSIGSMFGDNGANNDSDDDYDLDLLDGADPYEPVEEPLEVYDSDSALFAGHNTNCGLCYRTGFVPSHSLQRGMRLVLTHHDVVDAIGYFINKSEAPYRFERLSEQGYVEFGLKIPKYFKSAAFSIRNNVTILTDKLYHGQHLINAETVRQHAGKIIAVRVKANAFTHVSIEFYMDVELMRVNLPTINRQLDYTQLETVANLQVIIPPYIGACVAGDLIAAPTRNLYLKVVDITYTQTNTMRQLEWVANCRVLQPQESLRKLFWNSPF